MVSTTTEAEWQASASAFLKAEMKKAGVTYTGLVERLKAHGFEETEASVTMKLKRGTFAAAWLFTCIAALELEGIRLEDRDSSCFTGFRWSYLPIMAV